MPLITHSLRPHCANLLKAAVWSTDTTLLPSADGRPDGVTHSLFAVSSSRSAEMLGPVLDALTNAYKKYEE